jgi:hypothetical protein
VRTPLRSVPRLGQLHGPQNRLQQNMPAFANIHNVRHHLDFHVTLLRMNLYVATDLTYLSQVPHVPISCTALPEIIEELQIFKLQGVFTQGVRVTQKGMCNYFHILNASDISCHSSTLSFSCSRENLSVS